MAVTNLAVMAPFENSRIFAGDLNRKLAQNTAKLLDRVALGTKSSSEIGMRVIISEIGGQSVTIILSDLQDV